MFLLWEEYNNKCESQGQRYCSYPIFNLNYYKYTNTKNYTCHIEHIPGVEVEVDWSEQPTMSYIDPLVTSSHPLMIPSLLSLP